MNTFHLSGYPRIGAKRELKFAVEAFWKGAKTESELQSVAAEIRRLNWAAQKAAGADLLPVGDFSFYDHVLDLLCALGGIPKRFGFDAANLSLPEYFQLARGNATQFAMEMTKWFDTNYHFIVPEWSADTEFKVNAKNLIAQIKEAKAQGYDIKPTLVGPVTLAWLGKKKDGINCRVKDLLLPKLLPAYAQLLRELAAEGADWVQIDEPILAAEAGSAWLDAFAPVYQELSGTGVRILVGTYFASVAEHLDLLKSLPVQGLHIDCVRAPEQLAVFAEGWPKDRVLSVGLIDGRNVWRANLSKVIATLEPVKAKLGENLWIAPSCSLLHSPQDLAVEEKLDGEIKSWMAFAAQKLVELGVVKRALEQGKDAVQAELAASDAAAADRATNKLIHNDAVKARVAALPKGADQRKSPFAERIKAQQEWMKLPALPTTTIGSFPQTAEIRRHRAEARAGKISAEELNGFLRDEIASVIKLQEELGLDVLVHGEAERNDMVQYFAENFDGFATTRHGWVQSYGSRCTRPSILFGDVKRHGEGLRGEAFTVPWSSHAQSLSDKPVKGMLTGPVTILAWSFVRDDQPRRETANQVALALADEIADLEQAGIRIIQVDEPALRELLPLRRDEQPQYLDWSVNSFRLATSAVKDSTQIHTHLCYSEFNEIIDSINALNADVTSIEAARSHMELLADIPESFVSGLGPGVWDIHSPRVPSQEEIESLLKAAIGYGTIADLWVNPDCGLKTRDYEETKQSLRHLVDATKAIRASL